MLFHWGWILLFIHCHGIITAASGEPGREEGEREEKFRWAAKRDWLWGWRVYKLHVSTRQGLMKVTNKSSHLVKKSWAGKTPKSAYTPTQSRKVHSRVSCDNKAKTSEADFEGEFLSSPSRNAFFRLLNLILRSLLCLRAHNADFPFCAFPGKKGKFPSRLAHFSLRHKFSRFLVLVIDLLIELLKVLTWMLRLIEKATKSFSLLCSSFSACISRRKVSPLSNLLARSTSESLSN